MQYLLLKLKMNWLQAILLVLLSYTVAAVLLMPICDPDFFWHLKAGEWIWQNRTLPDHDIFNYTTTHAVTTAIRFTLTSYWVSQVMIYLAFLSGGMAGIVILRFLFLALLIYTISKRLQGGGVINLSLLVFLAVMLVNFYFFERPQILSFIFFGMVLLFLERIKAGGARENDGPINSATNRYTFFLAIIMFFWSNSHGGFLLGQITLLIFMVTEGLKFLHQRLNPMKPERYGRLLIAGFSALICSLANPNNYQALLLMLQTKAGDPGMQIQEYSTLLEMFYDTHSPVVLLYLAVMVLTGIALLAIPRKTDVTEMVLLAFLGYFAFKYVRYAAFFPIAAMPVLADRFTGDVVARYARWVLPPLALFAVVHCGQREFFIDFAEAREGRWVSATLFPEKAADFIISNNMQGNMYNPYNWGGYLIWRLAPERRVYADGRNFNADIFSQSSLKLMQRKYGFNYIITYSHETTGEIAEMAKELLLDKEWLPVFLDRSSRSAIFIRNTPENAMILANRLDNF